MGGKEGVGRRKGERKEGILTLVNLATPLQSYKPLTRGSFLIEILLFYCIVDSNLCFPWPACENCFLPFIFWDPVATFVLYLNRAWLSYLRGDWNLMAFGLSKLRPVNCPLSVVGPSAAALRLGHQFARLCLATSQFVLYDTISQGVC